MPRKPAIWFKGEVKTPPFSARARAVAGRTIGLLQDGHVLLMPHSRSMPSIGKRCHELRIRDERVTCRVFYRVDSDAILIVYVHEEDGKNAEFGNQRLSKPTQSLRHLQCIGSFYNGRI